MVKKQANVVDDAELAEDADAQSADHPTDHPENHPASHQASHQASRQPGAARGDEGPVTQRVDPSQGGQSLSLIALVLAVMALIVGVAVLVLVIARPVLDPGTLAKTQFDVTQMTQDLAALEGRVAALGSAGSGAIAGASEREGQGGGDARLLGEIDGLRAQVGELRGAVTSAMITSAQVEAMAGSASNQDTSLSPRLIALEQALATLSQAGVATPAALATANARIDALEQTLQAVQGQTDLLAVDVDASISALAQGVDAQMSLAQSTQADALSTQTQSVQDELATAMGALASLREEVAGLASTASRVEDELVAQSKKNAASSARLLAVSRLRDALIAGRGVEIEAEALRLVTANDDTLSAVLTRLDPVAADAVPSLESLAQSFPKLWEQVQLDAALNAVEGDRLGQIWTRLKSLVAIQRVEGETGIMAMDGVEGHLARANFFIGNQRLTEALESLDQLEGAPRTAVEDFRNSLANRQAYDAVLADLDRWSLARLAADADSNAGADSSTGAESSAGAGSSANPNAITTATPAQ